MTFTYTQNTPNANDTVAKTQPIIKNNFNYLRAWGLFDHRFSASTTDVLTGAHNKITFPANISPTPVLGTAIAILFPSNSTGFNGISLVNSSGSFPITGRNPRVPASITDQGETCLPGGMLLKWGVEPANLSGQGSSTIAFAGEFPSICYNVQVTPLRTSALSSSSGLLTAVGNFTKTNFFFTWCKTGGSTCDGFYWTAIGR